MLSHLPPLLIGEASFPVTERFFTIKKYGSLPPIARTNAAVSVVPPKLPVREHTSHFLCTLPVESTAAITSGCRRPLLTARSRFRGKLTGVRSGLALCAASTGPHSLQKNLEHLLFPINAFPACIVSRLFVRVNTVFAFLCGLPRMGAVLCAAAAQSVQNAALALQGEAVLRHQMGTHLIHKVAV